MTSSLLRAVVALTVALAVLAGCSPAGPEARIQLIKVDVPLREPTWVPEKKAVLAVSEDRRRVVRVDVAAASDSAAPLRSEKLEDAGENLALSPEEPEVAYLGRPKAGKVSALDTGTLRVVDSYGVGDSPGYVTLDVQSEVLFALSEEGTEVSSVELETPDEIPAVSVEGGAETLVEAPEKGLDPAFWTAGRGGVSYYHGDPPKRLVGRSIEAADIAVDLTSSQRAYVAEGERVVALEGDPQDYLEGELEVVATRDLGAKVEHVASDELHVFAATKDRLVAMRRHDLEPAETVEFGQLLEREGIAPPDFSGVTVGTEDVYLALEGEPYVLSVEKP